MSAVTDVIVYQGIAAKLFYAVLAGPGFGGSCFPKDVAALIKTAADFLSPIEIVETVQRVNDRHQALMLDKARAALVGTLAGKRVALLGLAFKAGTDDVRDSPALVIGPRWLGRR